MTTIISARDYLAHDLYHRFGGANGTIIEINGSDFVGLSNDSNSFGPMTRANGYGVFPFLSVGRLLPIGGCAGNICIFANFSNRCQPQKITVYLFLLSPI